MKNVLLSMSLITLLCSATSAQEIEPPAPAKEHQWLQQFAGEWSSKSTSTPTGDQPAIDCTGTMTSRMLGEFWVVNEMKAEVQGVAFRGLQTIGYDAGKKKYVGTWVDTMIPYLWKYEGTVDGSGKKLLLMTEGPNYTGGSGVSKYRDSYEFSSQDHINVQSEIMGDDGEWTTIMTGEMRRK